MYDVGEYLDERSDSVDVVIEASGRVDNVTRVFRRLNANGRVALLGRSGNPLILHSVDHMITNQISIVGSRGHLCGAFDTVLKLYMCGKLPLDEIVTHVVDGLEGLLDVLRSPGLILGRNCKILARLNGQAT